MTGKIAFLLIFCFNAVLSLAMITLGHPDKYRNTCEMALAHGYPCENHTIITPDRYLLLAFRIPGTKGESLEQALRAGRQPVILQHGVIDSSDNFLINENPALGYLMADQGLDVWITNFRGNEYSRRHLTLNPDIDEEFWNFSIDEIVDLDIPSMLDYVSKVTGFEKISHVGHSMGSGSILAAAARNPEYYASRLRSVVGFSPSTSSRSANHLLRLSHFLPILNTLESFGIREMFNMHHKVHSVISWFCNSAPAFCSNIIHFIAGVEEEYDNTGKFDVFFHRYPDGTSTKLLRHILQQTTKLGYFRYKDSSQSDPEEYDFTKVPSSIPIAIFAGIPDKLSSYMDIRWLAGKLQESGSLRLHKEYQGYGHLTYILPLRSYEAFHDAIQFTLESH